MPKLADGLSKAAAARKYNTTPKTVAKWVERFRSEGVNGLRDRSSPRLRSTPEIGNVSGSLEVRVGKFHRSVAGMPVVTRSP
jgi:transposase-like protein